MFVGLPLRLRTVCMTNASFHIRARRRFALRAKRFAAHANQLIEM